MIFRFNFFEWACRSVRGKRANWVRRYELLASASEGRARLRFLLAGFGSGAGRLLALLAGDGEGLLPAWKSIVRLPSWRVMFRVQEIALSRFSHLGSWLTAQASRKRRRSSDLTTRSISIQCDRCSNVQHPFKDEQTKKLMLIRASAFR